MFRDFERWPRYKELYIKAFDEMIKRHQLIKDANGNPTEVGGANRCSRLTSRGYEWIEQDRPEESMRLWLETATPGGGAERVVELERRGESDLLDEQQQQISRGGAPQQLDALQLRIREGLAITCVSDGSIIPTVESTFIKHQSDVPYNNNPEIADFESGESIVESLTYKTPFKHGGGRWLTDEDILKDLSGRENFEYWTRVACHN